jgi:hypothetical protein
MSSQPFRVFIWYHPVLAEAGRSIVRAAPPWGAAVRASGDKEPRPWRCQCSCLFPCGCPHAGANARKRSRGMKGRRPPFRNRDAESRRFIQAAAARKRRLLPLSPSEPAAPLGDAPPTTARPVEITDETASPSSIQPGLRQYQAPTLQQPPQPWLSSGAQNPPLVLRLSEVQGPPTVTGGESPPMPPPGSGNSTGSPLPDAGASGMVAAAGRIGVAHTTDLPGAEAKTAAGALSVNVEPNVVPITVDTPVTLDAAALRAAGGAALNVEPTPLPPASPSKKRRDARSAASTR